MMDINININTILPRHRAILQKIVDQDGDCYSIECSQCPFSFMIERPDGSFMSCLSIVNALQGSNISIQDGLKKTAVEILMKIAVEEMLTSDTRK
jgi:hypothetical protein